MPLDIYWIVTGKAGKTFMLNFKTMEEKMMDYAKLAKELLDLMGGKQNVKDVTHCATRLRFNLKDDSVVDEAKVKKVKGVMGVSNKGGQFQVIIGQDVAKAHRELLKLGNFAGMGAGASKKEKGKVLDTISGIFNPILPAITGAGMMKALLVLLTALNVVSPTSQTYIALEFIADAAFYFLPMMLAVTSAKKFNTNAFLAITIAGVLLHPTFAGIVGAGEPFSFIGLPVQLVGYGTSVIPIILAVWLMSYVEKFAEKVTPKVVSFFVKPLLTILIVAPITLMVIGPLGMMIGNGLAYVFLWMSENLGWLALPVMAALCPWIVMTGMHHGFTPLTMSAFAKYGYDPITFPASLCSNIAQGGAALAVGFKSKNPEIKQLATSAGITAVFGVTEPALFGVNLRFKKPMMGATIGATVAAIYAGVVVLKAFAMATPGLASLAMFIGEGQFSKNILHAIITLVIALVVSFIATWMIGFEDEPVEVEAAEEEKEIVPLNKKVKVMSPMEGNIVPLSDVNDATFSQEIMGKGIAIEPTVGQVVAPFDGTVTALFHTKHAIGLTSDEGVEVLIHVGIDTVQLNGEHYKAYIQNGDKIKAGDLLVEFDIEAIKVAGYEVVTPVIITNTPTYSDIIPMKEGLILKGEELLTIL